MSMAKSKYPNYITEMGCSTCTLIQEIEKVSEFKIAIVNNRKKKVKCTSSSINCSVSLPRSKLYEAINVLFSCTWQSSATAFKQINIKYINELTCKKVIFHSINRNNCGSTLHSKRLYNREWTTVHRIFITKMGWTHIQETPSIYQANYRIYIDNICTKKEREKEEKKEPERQGCCKGVFCY